MNDGDILALERTRHQTLPFFAAAPDSLARSYASGKWSMRGFLLHLVDCESVYLDRLRRLIADTHPLLWNFDENRWAERLDHPDRSLAVAATLFTATRDAVIELVRLAPAETWARVGVHSEAGRRSIGQIVANIHQHNDHHLSQLRAIAAGESWQPRHAPFFSLTEPPVGRDVKKRKR
ncbi:MAG: DinB family protein [Planctomycetes bacterium]|nr:DinB family protein [Planctomycetota bacterium]